MKTNENNSIPAISVDTMVGRLGGLYISAIKKGLSLKLIPSVFLWGPPGVGKSDGVQQIAERISRETGKRTHVTDVRLLLFSPIDLRGVPMADRDRQFTEWLRPKIFDLDPSEDVVNLVFLDELSAAPQSVQAAAYQITLDRTVGEHKLPDNTIIIAAGNRTTDRSAAFRMPNALANRMLHFQIDVDFRSWRSWALRKSVHPLILGYLSYDPARLYQEPSGKEDVAYPTPRTWFFLSNLLNTVGTEAGEGLPEDLHYLIGSCIGTGPAIEFEGWCSVYRKLPSAEDIFSGKKVKYPKKPDVLYALISSMIHYVSANEDISRSQLENACRYAARFPMDFATVFYSGLIELPGLDKQLIMVPEFRTWLERQNRAV